MIYLRFIYLIILLSCLSCEGYLELKPDKKAVVPHTEEDLWALLDNFGQINFSAAVGVGEMASDNVYFTDAVWNAVVEQDVREIYNWQPIPIYSTTWRAPYARIAICNVVLEHLPKVAIADEEHRRTLEGIARFTRAYSHYDVLQVFAAGYDPLRAKDLLGVPIRTTADINVPSRRETLYDSYAAMINDLRAAAELLPLQSFEVPTRPNKIAAWAALARCYLAMGDYEQAAEYSGYVLDAKRDLLDYRAMNVSRPYPFNRHNIEVLYHSELAGRMLMELRVRVDTNLYKSYIPEDLRKDAFFTKAADGYQLFTGDYAQSATTSRFNGLTTAEMILVHSESLARTGRSEESIPYINMLIKARYNSDAFLIAGDELASNVLARILEERRKELIFRGLRWTDLKRLAGEGKDLVRNLNGSEYRLRAADIADYAFKIPLEATDLSNLEQN